MKRTKKVNTRETEARKRLISWRKALRESTIALMMIGFAGLVVFVANDALQYSMDNRVSASNPPEMRTKALARARVGERYRVVVEGGDLDMAESLVMMATGLPEGLSLQTCKAGVEESGTRLRCYLTGVTNKAGQYNVQISIEDYQGNVGSRSYRLIVE